LVASLQMNPCRCPPLVFWTHSRFVPSRLSATLSKGLKLLIFFCSRVSSRVSGQRSSSTLAISYSWSSSSCCSVPVFSTPCYFKFKDSSSRYLQTGIQPGHFYSSTFPVFVSVQCYAYFISFVFNMSKYNEQYEKIPLDYLR
jgi:hypothetical protein